MSDRSNAHIKPVGPGFSFGPPRLGLEPFKDTLLLKLRSMFLPGVFAEGCLSAAPQRLWPAVYNVQGPRDNI